MSSVSSARRIVSTASGKASDRRVTTFGGGIETAYTATDTTLEMGEESGAMACASGQIGVYEWEIGDDVLTMTLVSDDCSGRGGIVDGISLQRAE